MKNCKLIVSLVAVGLCANFAAFAADPASVATPANMEVFEGPKPKESPTSESAAYLLSTGKEAWVNLSLMIDSSGKPYEITATDSMGDKGFIEHAVSTVESWRFTPAKLNGKPVDSGFEFKVTYRQAGGTGATRAFEKAYERLMAATAAKDRTAADAAMSLLKPRNLFEDAYMGIAQFAYAVAWGDEQSQYVALKRAIAYESGAHYLPKSAFSFAQKNILPLHIRFKDYAGATKSWEALKGLDVDSKVIDGFAPTMEKIAAVKTSAVSYSVPGEVSERSWHYRLFKKRFVVRVSEGRVSELKLRCDKKFVFFSYDPQLEYRIADSFGECSLQVVGDPGTKFDLVQR